VLNVFKVPFSRDLGLISQGSFLLNLKLAPAILLGGALGVLVVKRLSNKRYQVWIQIIAAIGACRMLYKGLLALGVLAGG
jgi:uncharacterized membrane protein YfcA